LNSKNLETFQSSLITQYRDLVHEAILESEIDHKTRLDVAKLNAKLKIILKAAHYDGIPEDVISQLIDEALPSVYNKAA
jgi:hypothetical protein